MSTLNKFEQKKAEEYLNAHVDDQTFQKGSKIEQDGELNEKQH